MGIKNSTKTIYIPIRTTLLITFGLILTLSLSSCFTRTIQHGHVIQPETLEEIEVGASTEQIELLLGTPSTITTLKGVTYYYISQKAQQTAFFRPKITDQHVVAIYFNNDSRVERYADYGLKDEKVFDFISRETPTGGAEYSFLSQILRGATTPGIGL